MFQFFRIGRARRTPLLAVAFTLASVSQHSVAAGITLTANNPGGTSGFNSGTGWPGGLAPIAGNDYLTSSFVLRTPADSISRSFAGDSLSVDPGGRFLLKNTGTTAVITVGNLVLNGGTMDYAVANNDSLVVTVAGVINANAASIVGSLGAGANGSPSFETLDLTATLSGSAGLTIAGSGNGGLNTGVVKLSAANTYGGTITVATPGSGFVASGTNRLLQLNHLNALQGATLSLTSVANGISFASPVNTGGAFNVGALSGASNQVLADTSGSAVILNVGGNDASTTYSGILSGAGGLAKSGNGTLTLSGAHLYTGNTTIHSGTLALNGSGALSSPNLTIMAGSSLDVSGKTSPTLASNQNLLGSGTVNGSLTTASTSRIYPATDGTAGTLTFNNGLTMTPAAVFNMDVGTSAGSGNDAVNVNGNLALNNTIFNLRALTGTGDLATDADYVLVTAAAISGSPDPAVNWIGAPPANAANFSIIATSTRVTLRHVGAALSCVAVADPSSVAASQSSTLLTVSVTPGTLPVSSGLAATGDLTSIGGSSSQTFYDDGTHGDVASGDNVFSYNATLASSTAPGIKSLELGVNDAQGRNVSAVIFLMVTPDHADSYMATPFLPVSESNTPGSLPLAAGGQAAPIHYSPEEAAVVGIAANALRDDVQRVTGLVPGVSTTAPTSTASAVLIGTVGNSTLIDGLVASGKIDVSAIQGKWEAYTTAVVENPVAGVGRALVIAGSDRRGTAYGVFGLSEAMGVSPWYWWGDVPARPMSALHVSAGTYTGQTPGVKYRGIFINDEDWGLEPWARLTSDPSGDIGPTTYGKVFELLLRLHSNFIWPAMHPSTRPFYTVPGNKEIADNYAIVVGTSHHEPMLRNTDEYNTATLGPYNYWTNRTNIYNFWDQRVTETANYENSYTLGMRGLGDGSIASPSGTTTAQKVAKIQNGIFPDQRQMIANRVNANPASVFQIYVPYKEALTQYQAGLVVPDDVTLVWPDDNHGYIRQLSNTVERTRSGGSGIYYHLSYWGDPANYLWICTTPPALVWSEMSKAWDYDTKRLWLVNIGDIKPGEIGMEFFLRLARNPEAFRNFDQHAYLSQWAARNFGFANAEAIATIMGEYYRLNVKVRPEHLNRTTSGFDFVANGDEAQKRLDEFAALAVSADAVYAQLPANQKAAFYGMVLYPVRGSNLLNREILLAERSRLWATQRRAATSSLGAQAVAARTSILSETTFYNQTNANGKWNGVMQIDTTSQAKAPFIMPTVGTYTAPSTAGLGVAVEGASTVLAAGTAGALPQFNAHANQSYFIDVFNTGTNAMSWTAQASAPWITLTKTGGTADARILVGVDWTKAPRGYAVPGNVSIMGADGVRTVNVTAFHPLSLDLAALPRAVENNGVVTIEAEDFHATQNGADGVGWRKIKDAAASDDGMTILPTTAASISPASISDSTPSLTYRFYAFATGNSVIRMACLPTHEINSEHPGCRYAISLNGDTPQIVDINADAGSAAWNVNVLRAAAYGLSNHTISSPGLQTVKISMIDPGVVLDKLTITISSLGLEAEDMAFTTSGAYHPFTETGASGGGAVSLDATAVGQSITFVLPDMAAGIYDFTAGVKKGPSRGISQMSIGDTADGVFTNIGAPVEFYNGSLVYADLAAVRVTVSTPGTKYLKFAVTGKNAASSGYLIILDHFTWAPVTGTGGTSENWRSAYFGTVANAGEAADLADPDSDGISNLLEYATGSYPTATNGPLWTSAITGGHLTLTFPRLKDATGVTYRVMASNDLTAESEIWSSAVVPYPGGSAPSVLTTVTDPQTTTGSPSRFLRLEVTRP